MSDPKSTDLGVPVSIVFSLIFSLQCPMLDRANGPRLTLLLLIFNR